MPILEIRTNVKLEDPRPFVTEFSQFAADVLKKPLQYICVVYDYKEYMAWNGTFEPAFLLNIVSLDNLTPDLNETYSKAVFEFFEQKLGVKGNRGYISFNDPGRDNLGHQGTTVASLAGNK